MEEFLQVGAIANTHGIAGEVKVFPMTDDIKRFKKLKEVYLDTGRERKLLHVVSCKFVKNQPVLKFRMLHLFHNKYIPESSPYPQQMYINNKKEPCTIPSQDPFLFRIFLFMSSDF